MMVECPRFSPQRLAGALNEIPSDAWSLPSSYAETRVHHGYRRVVLVSAGCWQEHAKRFAFVWDVLNPVRDAWLSWIDPGGFIVPHRDPGPWRERWQVPISTSGDWRDDSGASSAIDGEAFLVRHWESHAVVNRGDGPRIHLVVDRNVRIDRVPQPFEVFDVPPDMVDLIERSRC